MPKYLAQKLCFPDGSCIDGPMPTLANKPPGEIAFTSLASVISIALPWIFRIAGIIFFVMLIVSGFGYLTSMGDPKKAEKSKARLTSSLIGLLIIIFAYWITIIIDSVFRIGIYTTYTPIPTPTPP